MSETNSKPRQFLGRDYDFRTMTYSFPDKSGGILPEEMRQDVIAAVDMRLPNGANGIFVLSKIWEWKDRIAAKGETK